MLLESDDLQSDDDIEIQETVDNICADADYIPDDGIENDPAYMLEYRI